MPNKRLPRAIKPRLSRLKTTLFLTLLVVAGIVAASILVRARDAADQIPSFVAWTPETIAAASAGNAFRGMLRAKSCEHCHGTEGFSATGSIPNLAGMNNLAIWKQLEDFRNRKRASRAMGPVAESLSVQEVSDVVAYYAALPVFPDPQDNRVFPLSPGAAERSAVASHLISFGDGERGIPPCQACHGPVAYKAGVPSLLTQNGEYVLNQLDAFASGKRSNDINQPMRTIAKLLTPDERKALAEFYGAGLGLQAASAK